MQSQLTSKICSIVFLSIAQAASLDSLEEDFEEGFLEGLNADSYEEMDDEDCEGLEDDEQDHREEDGEVSAEATPGELLVSICSRETSGLLSGVADRIPCKYIRTFLQTFSSSTAIKGKEPITDCEVIIITTPFI